MRELKITYRAPGELKPSPRNSRKHSTGQISRVARSITTFGFIEPVIINRDDEIIVGHARTAAALEAKLASIPTVLNDDMSSEQMRAYCIASNRLAELSDWDEELLALELGELENLNLDFDLTSVGFDTADIDRMLGSFVDGDGAVEKPVPELSESHVSQVGDLWHLGCHKLYCGDATQTPSYQALMGDERARMILSDVPYNIKIPNMVSGLGKTKHRNFVMASGEMSDHEFTRFLTTAFRLMAAASLDGSLHYVFIDWRSMLLLLRAGSIAYNEHKAIVTWVKAAGSMGSLYRGQSEFIVVFKNGTAPHLNNIELGRHGRNRTNVWQVAGLNSFQPDREKLLAMHPTVKPISLCSDAILDCTNRDDIVLDPFVGSGTTILAAERVNRRCYAMELDPRFADVALKRFREDTSIDPVGPVEMDHVQAAELAAGTRRDDRLVRHIDQVILLDRGRTLDLKNVDRAVRVRAHEVGARHGAISMEAYLPGDLGGIGPGRHQIAERTLHSIAVGKNLADEQRWRARRDQLGRVRRQPERFGAVAICQEGRLGEHASPSLTSSLPSHDTKCRGHKLRRDNRSSIPALIQRHRGDLVSVTQP